MYICNMYMPPCPPLVADIKKKKTRGKRILYQKFIFICMYLLYRVHTTHNPYVTKKKKKREKKKKVLLILK